MLVVYKVVLYLSIFIIFLQIILKIHGGLMDKNSETKARENVRMLTTYSCAQFVHLTEGGMQFPCTGWSHTEQLVTSRMN